MDAASYGRKFDELFGTRRGLARFTDVVGAREPSVALVPVAQPSSFDEFVRGIAVDRPKDVSDGIGTLAGAVIGGYAFYGTHPYLGIIGGASLGRNVPALFNAGESNLALRNMIETGSAVAGSLWLGRRGGKAFPILGYILGRIVGGIVVHYGGIK